ncbi:MAG: hypothetical protein ABH883_06760 [Candidatus Omnitrophota bacterium]
MKLLAESEKMGNVARYCDRILQLNIKPAGISLYFENEAFLMLADLIEKARLNIIDDCIENLLYNNKKDSS